jgi:hypothetical protein
VNASRGAKPLELRQDRLKNGVDDFCDIIKSQPFIASVQ